MQSLQGTWSCTDGGTYYITQRDNNVFINGSNANTTDDIKWINVGFGVINPDTSSVVVFWSDTPNSANTSHGIEYLDASQQNVITKTGSSYGYGNFTRKSN